MERDRNNEVWLKDLTPEGRKQLGQALRNGKSIAEKKRKKRETQKPEPVVEYVTRLR